MEEVAEVVRQQLVRIVNHMSALSWRRRAPGMTTFDKLPPPMMASEFDRLRQLHSPNVIRRALAQVRTLAASNVDN